MAVEMVVMLSLNRIDVRGSVGIDDRVERRRLRHFTRVGRDVREHRRIGDGTGRRSDVPANQLDPEHRRSADHGRLLLRIDVAEDDAVRLQRDRLIERRRAALHRALSVEDAEIPPHRLRGFLRAIARPLRSAVPLIGGHVDDQLLPLRHRARRRTGPWRARRGHPGDVVLRHLHVGSVRGGGRRCVRSGAWLVATTSTSGRECQQDRERYRSTTHHEIPPPAACVSSPTVAAARSRRARSRRAA